MYSRMMYSSSSFFLSPLRFIIHSMKTTATAIDMLNQFRILMCVSLIYFYFCVDQDTHARCSASNVVR